jgi:hypothetical protein
MVERQEFYKLSSKPPHFLLLQKARALTHKKLKQRNYKGPMLLC